MKYIITLFLLFVLVMVAFSQEKTYQYGPAKVHLCGVFSHKTFFGPPNYGENPETDSKEHVTIMTLDSAITVLGKPNDDVNSDTNSNVKEIQVVNLHDINLKRFYHKKVIVGGSLFCANTGHHHTNVLIELESIKELK